MRRLSESARGPFSLGIPFLDASPEVADLLKLPLGTAGAARDESVGASIKNCCQHRQGLTAMALYFVPLAHGGTSRSNDASVGRSSGTVFAFPPM